MNEVLSITFIYLTFSCHSGNGLITDTTYYYVPQEMTSYCTRKLNSSDQIGCSSQLKGSAGTALLLSAANDTIQFLQSNHNKAVFVLVMDYTLFVNNTLMHDVRSSSSVVGLIVFGPSDAAAAGAVTAFSESSACPNSHYSYYGAERQCNVTPAWNPEGTDYSSIDWPFPVVLLRDRNATLKAKLQECYGRFNIDPQDDTRCSIEINNPMSAVRSSVLCTRRQSLMSLQIFESPWMYCDEFSGVNIVLSAINTSVSPDTLFSSFPTNQLQNHTARAANSTILVLTRLDSRSMFERSGFASQGILPSVSVLIATAAHLMRQSSFKNFNLTRDVFFVFLDNEAYDFLGSGRLSYDLRNQRLAVYTGFPLGWDHVRSVIELGELGRPEQNPLPTYFMLYDSNEYEQTKAVTDDMIGHLMAASERFGQLNLTIPKTTPDIPLPPSASLQSLLSLSPKNLPHLLLTDHDGSPFKDKYFESFLDTRWPPDNMKNADQTLLLMANVLADGLHRMVTPNFSPMDGFITDPTPGDLMDCFVNNPNCSILRPFLSPEDVQFLLSLETPIPAQSYLPIENRELKIAHIVSVLLMGLTGKRTATSHCPTQGGDGDPYVYLMGYYNGSEQCYRTLLDLASRFVLFDDDIPVPPAWMRSRSVSSNRYVRWYRSASTTLDGFVVALGVFLILLTGCCAFAFQGTINKELSAIRRTTIPEIRGSSVGDGEHVIATRT